MILITYFVYCGCAYYVYAVVEGKGEDDVDCPSYNAKAIVTYMSFCSRAMPMT